MNSELLHDRGRGPELVGTRITVYDLLPYFFDPTATETYICELYDLTGEQVAAARAYVVNNADVVLAKHLEIEQRLAEGNPPEVRERAKQTHETFVRFKEWLDEREADTLEEESTSPASFPSFREWLEERKVRVTEGS